MTTLDEMRHAACETAFETFAFSPPVDSVGHWERDGAGSQWTRPVYVEIGDETQKASFVVTFKSESDEILEVEAKLGEQLIGEPAPATSFGFA